MKTEIRILTTDPDIVKQLDKALKKSGYIPYQKGISANGGHPVNVITYEIR